MTKWEAVNPDYERKIRENIQSQAFMRLIGAEVLDMQPGYCEISVPYREDLCHHPGGFHPGLIGAMAMNAAGYATFPLTSAEAPYSILTLEYKLNLLVPPEGDALVARGRVLKPSRSITVAQCDIDVIGAGRAKACASALITLMIA